MATGKNPNYGFKVWNDGAMKSMWGSNWRIDSTPLNQDAESVSDNESQISDTANDHTIKRWNSDAAKWDVKERMKRLFETQCYTDVTFYQKNNRNVSISAHRAVLAIGSPLFTKMLFGDDLKHAGQKMEVQISNMPFDVFTNILKYFYTDEVFFESDLHVIRTLAGAKQFEIQPLVRHCEQYFELLELTDQNVCSKLHLSLSKNIHILKVRCVDFIQRNTLQVINSKDFKTCTAKTVRAICKLQSLNLPSEMELLKAIMSWLHLKPPQSRKQLMSPLQKHIRFLTFTVNELGDTLKKYPKLMTQRDGVNIMLCLHNIDNNPDFESLPSWCNKSTVGRCFSIEESRVTNTGNIHVPTATNSDWQNGSNRWKRAK